MTQRLMFVISAGVAAFVVVMLTAVVAYLLLGGAPNTTAFASQGDSLGPSQGLSSSAPQQSAPNTQGIGDSGTQNSYPVSADDAANLALSSVPGSTLMQQPRLVNFSGAVAYEVQLDTGYVYVDAQSGQVIYNGANGTQSYPPRQRSRRR